MAKRKNNTLTCNACRGEGFLMEPSDPYNSSSEDEVRVKCYVCSGFGFESEEDDYEKF